MGLPYLKVQPEQAVQTLDKCIVSGYQIKDKITEQYISNKQKADEKIQEWEELAGGWALKTVKELEGVFVSQKELYNFRDAQPTFGATMENVQYVGIKKILQARINKLNEYDMYIRNQFNVKIEVIGRDKIIQNGDGGTIKTNN
jgi:hypothetical protein